MTKDELERLIEARFASMSPRLRQAARHVLGSPKDVALQSMRSFAASGGLQPASMLRLAKELGFDSYESLRDVYIQWLSNNDTVLLRRALQLRSHSEEPNEPLARFFRNELTNLDRTFGPDNAQALTEAARLLLQARHLYLLGLRSLFPAAYYLHYVCSTFLSNVTLLSGTGGTFADELRRISNEDVLVCFSSFPYTVLSVKAVEFAVGKGSRVVAIADSPVSPIASRADISIIAPNASDSLFPSILPAIAAAHTLTQLMVSQGGEDTLSEIANSESQLQSLGTYVKS